MQRFLVPGLLVCLLSFGFAARSQAGVATGVTNVAIDLSTAAASASAVRYAVSFKVTTKLSAGDPELAGKGASTIRIGAPVGTVFPSSVAAYTIRDLTAGTDPVLLCEGCASPAPVVSSGNVVTLATPIVVPAGHDVEVVAHGVTNSPALGGDLTVQTSLDILPVPVSLGLVSKSYLINPIIFASDVTLGASNVEYVVDFITSASGGLNGGNSLGLGFGASIVSIAAPDGTVFPTDAAAYTMADLTKGGAAADLCADCVDPVAVAVAGTNVDIAVPSTLVAGNVTGSGNVIRIVIEGVRNPDSSDAFEVSTTSDFATVTGLAPQRDCGDQNLDGNVSASDALGVLRTAVGEIECQLCVCDVNDSGDVVASDALAVLRHAVGTGNELVCPSCAI